MPVSAGGAQFYFKLLILARTEPSSDRAGGHSGSKSEAQDVSPLPYLKISKRN